MERTPSRLAARRSAPLLAVASCAALITLTGCSSAYVEKYGGLPSGVPQDPTDGLSTGEPSVAWGVDGDVLLTLYGSSSCPPEPEAVSAPDASTIIIEIGSSGGAFCTADLAATTYRILTPDGVDDNGPVSVDLGDTRILTLLPAGATE